MNECELLQSALLREKVAELLLVLRKSRRLMNMAGRQTERFPLTRIWVGLGVFLLTAAALAAPLQPVHFSPPSLTSSFDPDEAKRDVLAIMTRRRIPGAQVVVVTPGEVIWREAFGLADLETRQPMTFNTPLQVGSITKVFTATILADMVAKDEIAWSDTLGELLPGVAIRSEVSQMTVGEIASHTARLPLNPPNRVDVGGTWRPYSRAELYAALADQKFSLVTQGWNYSNFGFAILGHVIEISTGKSYGTVLQDRVLKPLQMDESQMAVSAAGESGLATHYWPEDKPLRARPPWVFGEVAAFGGLTSTADDIAKFLQYQMKPAAQPSVLDAEAIFDMRTVRAILPDWRLAVGRPWFERRAADGTLTIEHGGEVDGHSAIIIFSPSRSVGVVVLANIGQTGAEEIALPVLSRALAAARLRNSTRDEAMQFFDRREWAEAEAALAAYLATIPLDGEAWYRLGRARYEMRDLAGAQAALDRSRILPAAPAAAHLYAGAVAALQNRADDAFTALERGVDAGLSDPASLHLAEFRSLRTDARWRSLLGRMTAAPPIAAPARTSNGRSSRPTADRARPRSRRTLRASPE